MKGRIRVRDPLRDSVRDPVRDPLRDSVREPLPQGRFCDMTGR